LPATKNASAAPFLLDLINIHLEVPRVDYEKLTNKRNAESSATIRTHIQATRERQLQRFTGTKLTSNAEMHPSEVRDFSKTSCMKSPALSVHLNDGSID